MTFSRRYFGAFLSASILAACGGQTGGQTVVPSAQNLDRPANIVAAAVVTPGPNLYVANVGSNTISVYGPNSTSVLRTISTGVSTPEAMTFDKSGDLFVGNFGYGGSASITAYAKGK